MSYEDAIKQMPEYRGGLLEEPFLPVPRAALGLGLTPIAVLAAATETVEDNGHTYPVIKFQMNVTGTLAGSPAVKEKAEMAYYILGYWGEEYAKS